MDAGVEKTLMLTIQGQVPAGTCRPSIPARKLTSAAERSSTFAGAGAVRIVWVSRRLTTLRTYFSTT